MSFIGRSAEEVYRYALRRDRDGRSLSDGFGFSIVFINDESPDAARFLLDYFKQLSHRTSNRVRFIFFGEMTEAETIERQTRGASLGDQWIRRAHASMWRELQPDALELVEQPEKTLAQWVEASAVPDSAGTAIRFAQRLGVAEHVPCLLIFRDVGELRVHVMPMRGLPPSEVFAHVCLWVDQFYKENQPVLMQWEDAEREIAELRSSVDGGLKSIRAWLNSTRARHAELREVAGAIRHCEGLRGLPPGMWRGRLADIMRGLKTPAASAHLADLDRSLSTLARFQEVEPRARDAGAQLRSANSADAILEALHDLVGTGVLLGGEAERAIRELEHQVAAFRLSDPDAQLRAWRDTAPKRPSFGEYMRATVEWDPLRTRPARDEFSLIFQQVHLLSVDLSPEAGTRLLIDQVVRQFGGRDPERWLAASAGAERLIRSHLEQLLGQIPDWLRTVPKVTIAQAKGPDAGARAAVERRRVELAEALRGEGERLLARARAVRDEALVALEAALSMIDVRAEHLEAALTRHIDVMRAHREAVERDLQTSIESMISTGRPVDQIGPQRMRRLLDALDQYDAAIDSLVYEYERDPMVIPVPIGTSVGQAAGVSVSPHVRPSRDVRERLESAFLADREIGWTFDEGIAEAGGMMPARALDSALRATLAPERVLQLFGDTSDPSRVLSQLLPEELAHVHAHFQLDRGAPPGSTSGTVADILAAIGADPSGKDTRPATYDFDVFLSYPAPQRADVERIAHALKAGGLKPWLDGWEVVPGSEFTGEIERVMTRSRAFAVFIGPEGVGVWQRREISSACAAAKRGVRLVPVLLGSASWQAVPPLLRAYSHVQIADAADSSGIEKLIRGLTHSMTAAA